MKSIIDEKIIKKFTIDLVSQIKETSNFFNQINLIENKNYLPEAFRGNSINANVFHSIDKKQIMFVFFKSDFFKFNYSRITGEIIDVYDFYNLWGKSSAFHLSNSSNVSIKDSTIKGLRPFSLEGKSEIILENLEFYLPYPRNMKVVLDYTMVFSIDKFSEILNQNNQFSYNIAMTYIDYFRLNNEKFSSNTDNKEQYKFDLTLLKNNMYEYFFTDKYHETEIESFINSNPSILKYGLDIIDIKVQLILKDVHKEIGQDLKPDLIGFDSIKKVWTIIDYKLPQKKLIRASGTVRASVTADITQLESQLKKYREYFSDKIQRDYVNNKYDLDIKKYPPTIGIIGRVFENQRDDFNEKRHNYPGWFRLVSYDELYEKVSSFIDTALIID